MKQKRTYVVVFADKTEHFVEIMYNSESFSAKNICQDAVRSKKLTTSRKNPQTVAVELFAVEISGGQLNRRKVGNYEVMPSLERMNSEEYNEELAEAIEELPEEFQSYVSHAAWERGHSAGYEEVVNIAREMASDLLPHLQRYQKRIMEGLVG